MKNQKDVCSFIHLKEFSSINTNVKQDLIGKKVMKISKYPFKSTFLVATIKDIIEHPLLPNQSAFLFEEDDSYVRIIQCCFKF